MNEDFLKSEVQEYAKKLFSAMDNTGEFVLEQAPIVVQEYICWYIWSNIFIAVMLLIFSIVLWFVSKKFISACEELEKKGKDEVPALIMGVKSFIISLVLAGSMFCPSYYAVKGICAPRIIVLEKMADLAGFKKATL